MKDWTFESTAIANNFDSHVREQLPWYELATESVAFIIRHYLPFGGLIYDIGASTGNIEKSIAELLEQRQARFVPIEKSKEMSRAYDGSSECVTADAVSFSFEEFDIAVCFLSLMFMPVCGRRELISRLLRKARPGGAIVIVDKVSPPSGYSGQVLRRMTMHWKLRNGASADEIIAKELSLSGIQRPMTTGDVGNSAVEFFRLGEFAGWIIEAASS